MELNHKVEYFPFPQMPIAFFDSKGLASDESPVRSPYEIPTHFSWTRPTKTWLLQGSLSSDRIHSGSWDSLVQLLKWS